MQTQVIPAYVNNPKQPGGKYGNIKLQDGTLYFVPVNMLGNFAANTPANIDYENQTWGRDDNAKLVRVVTGINGQNITGQAGPVQGGDRPAPTAQNVPLKPRADESESIFVTGIVGRAMGSGNFTAEDIGPLTKAAAQAWQDRHQFLPQEDDFGLTPPPGDPYGP